MEIISLFSFTNFAFLGALLALPLLVLAYKKNKHQKKIRVSSTFILKDLKQKKIQRKSIKLPLRFYIELLALILLVLAASGLYIKSNAESYIVYIDNSASMSVANESTKQSRLEMGIEQLKESLDSHSWFARYRLFTSNIESETINKSNFSKYELLNSINSLKPLPIQSTIKEDLDYLLSQFNNKFIIISDKDIQSANKNVHLISPWKSRENIAIRNFTVENQNNKKEIIIEAIYYGDKNSIDATLTLNGIIVSDSSEDIITLLTKEISFTKNKLQDFRYPLPSNLADINSLKISLNTDNQNINSLALDDRAWLALDQVSTDAILLISPVKNLKEVGLDAITNYTFKIITPDQYNKSSITELSKYAAHIFHKTSPDNLQRINRNSLFITPPSSTLFQASELYKNPKISSVLTSHPLTKYINFSILNIPQATSYASSIIMQPIVSIEQGAILLEGAHNGNTIILLGTEIFPFDKNNAISNSILFLNILQKISHNNAKTESSPNKTNQIGLQIINNQITANNLFSESESNTMVQEQITLNTNLANKSIANSQSDSISIWHYLLFISFVLFFLEYILRIKEQKTR